MESNDYYNDGGKHDNCTACGKPIQFIEEETKQLECGNILTPETMPFKKRNFKIRHWTCLNCGKKGKNYYLLE